MALDKKKLFILVPIALVFLFTLVELTRVWWYRGYSKGSRTGVVRKISIKGPPYCKYFSGELALQGGQPGQPPEIWEFSIDGADDEKNPLVVNLKEAERSGARVTLNYRQDLHSLFRCTPSEYFVGSLEK
ncbi:MAG: hypothetical protein H6Q89_5383 [Myxococcaceae bacterium]|nr:hypothetical protein [Myxococcaceae bacterium]